jgi:Ca2+-binding RTX toxin-like protein
MIWNPGDGNDLNEGGAGNDTSEQNGGNGAENFTATANGNRVRFDRIDPAPFFVDIGTTENLVLNANGGDDSFSATGNLAVLIQIIVDGGAGNDRLLGGNGADRLVGGDDNDFIDGNGGNDTVFLGAGDDTFQWDPGDGSDTVEGGDGTDVMAFNGSNLDEKFDISANGQRVRMTRDLGNIVMDLNDVERIDLNALGGADQTTVNDLTGTDLVQVNVNQTGTPGGTTGDGAADAVIVNGTNGNDAIQVLGSGTTGFSVVGLSALVFVTNSEGANDSLTVKALGGEDNVNASTMVADIVKLTEEGGTGNDTLVGSRGNDTLFGGDGDDTVFGFRGDDVMFGGAGRDVFEWDPGDGSDTIEGGDGSDTMLFNGANIDEIINISANGNRVRFTRDIANITMDLNDVEEIDFNAFDGADTIIVNDLSATALTALNLNLNNAADTSDGKADSVTVTGTKGADAIQIASFDNGTRVAIGGLFPFVNITGAEGANDKLTVNTLAGNDVVDASGLEAGVIGLTLNGDVGNDVLIGSQGDDTFVWNPGDGSDTLEGQAGADTMIFNGNGADEKFEALANGERVRFTRDIGTVVMDLNDVESIDLNALGGADMVTINDLSGTDVSEVNLNLAGTLDGNAGDAQADNVIVHGTSGDDVALVFGDANGVSVLGLAAEVNITFAEPAIDRLTVNALAGDDVIEASGLAAGVIGLTEIGDDGDDVLIGSDGNDTLLGGADNDVLNGGPGLDVLDGGTGDNILIQD